MNKKLITIAFTVMEWICVLMASFYALLPQSSTPLFEIIGAIIWLIAAGVCEWLEYRIIHNNYEDKQ